MKWYVFSIISIVSACTLEDARDGVNIDDIISFDEAMNGSVPADSTTPYTIHLTLGKDVTDDQEVTLTTDQGWFQGTASEEDQQKLVRTTSLKKLEAILVPDKKPSQQVTLTASVKTGTQTFTAVKRIEFTTAYPEALYVSVAGEIFPADGTGEATVTVFTHAAPGEGRPSDGTKVSIATKPTNAAMTLKTSPFVTLTNGTASFTVKSTNEEEGNVAVTVSMQPKNAAAITVTDTVRFQNP